MALDSGARLGPYEIVAWLGAGGMGEVYEAADTRLNRRVALKILPTALVADPERRQRFIQEVQLASALQPHAIACFPDRPTPRFLRTAAVWPTSAPPANSPAR